MIFDKMLNIIVYSIEEVHRVDLYIRKLQQCYTKIVRLVSIHIILELLVTIHQSTFYKHLRMMLSLYFSDQIAKEGHTTLELQ